MSSNSSESGCGMLALTSLGLAGGYIYALGTLGETHAWWHYLAAIPLGLLLADLMFFGASFTGGLLMLAALPGIGIWLIIELLRRDLNLWVGAAGVAYVLLGAFCATQANRRRSPGWAFNSLTGYSLGAVMIVIGVMAHFI